MLIPKKNRIPIYEYFFKERVMVAKKDYNAPKHPELETIPNLEVIKALQSLKSKEQFAWRHYYWYLTNPSIEYLRTFLHLPGEIVPSTLKRQARTETTRPRPAGSIRTEGGSKGGVEDKAGYRMMILKKNVIAIYEYLFKKGVMVAKKAYNASKHATLETIPNLNMIKALQALKSKGYVKEQFARRHYYC